ncbi:MAG TPA: hypothetical protein VFP20_04765 [Bacteroidales bacterium]|nr:hypothetical protein [Bacteroidales bacterium]
MEQLLIDLKERLILRRNIEAERVLKLDPQSDRDIVLMASGKIYELDEVIGFLDNMMTYKQLTEKITQ